MLLPPPQMLAALEQRLAANDATEQALAVPLAAAVHASLLELSAEAPSQSPPPPQQAGKAPSSGSQDADSGTRAGTNNSLQGVPPSALPLAAALLPLAGRLAGLIGSSLLRLVHQLEVDPVVQFTNSINEVLKPGVWLNKLHTREQHLPPQCVTLRLLPAAHISKQPGCRSTTSSGSRLCSLTMQAASLAQPELSGPASSGCFLLAACQLRSLICPLRRTVPASPARRCRRHWRGRRRSWAACCG